MNYRHIYHAGCISDIIKHATLTLCIAALKEKNTAFCVIDTHAGMGFYDLQEERAQKTGEAQEGIFKFMNAPRISGLVEYYTLLRKFNPHDGDIRYYPGSPMLAADMLRPQDRLIINDLHKDDYAELKALFKDNAQVHVHNRDGYEALKAFVPPKEKRGLVLIDPPFEKTDEFMRIVESIEAYKRWPNGHYLIWYPIKERAALWRFHEVLASSGIPKILCAEFIYNEEVRHDRLNGCGLIFINPIWQIDTKLEKLMPEIHHALGTKYHGVTVKWLTNEQKP